MWTPLVDVAKWDETPRKGLQAERRGAGTTRRTLKERESSREDEPAAKVVGDGDRWNTTRSFGNGEISREQTTQYVCYIFAYNTPKGSRLHERQHAAR
jgi:hypothetical protein